MFIELPGGGGGYLGLAGGGGPLKFAGRGGLRDIFEEGRTPVGGGKDGR